MNIRWISFVWLVFRCYFERSAFGCQTLVSVCSIHRTFFWIELHVYSLYVHCDSKPNALYSSKIVYLFGLFSFAMHSDQLLQPVLLPFLCLDKFQQQLALKYLNRIITKIEFKIQCLPCQIFFMVFRKIFASSICFATRSAGCIIILQMCRCFLLTFYIAEEFLCEFLLLFGR